MEILTLRNQNFEGKRRKRMIYSNKENNVETICHSIKQTDLEFKDFLNFWCSDRGLRNPVETFSKCNKTDIKGLVQFIVFRGYKNKFITFIRSEYGN